MIVVAAILEKGDTFLMGWFKYKVVKVDERGVSYAPERNSRGKRNKRLGINSRKKLILVSDCDYGDVNNFPNIFTNLSQ